MAPGKLYELTAAPGGESLRRLEPKGPVVGCKPPKCTEPQGIRSVNTEWYWRESTAAEDAPSI